MAALSRVAGVGVILALFCASMQAADADVRVTNVGGVADDVLAVTIDVGTVEYAGQEPYKKRSGDDVRPDGEYGPVWLWRDGKPVGSLVGPRRDTLWKFERYVSAPFDAASLSQKSRWRIVSPDHQQFRDPVEPSAVYRKSKPTDMARVGPWNWGFPVRHIVYLRLPQALKAGSRYKIEFDDPALSPIDYKHEPGVQRSEAVHMNQVGFRPDDPVKIAFLSCWLGDGGKLDYPLGLAFTVNDVQSGKTVFTGNTRLAAASDFREDAYGKNYSGVDVYCMDFGSLTKPGTYRVVVEGIGSSWPFEISKDAYRGAFRTAARGFYHQRSGIALGPPYTDYRRPRCFHPADGVVVRHSTCPLMFSGNGLNGLGTDKGNFGNLVAGMTDEVVEGAWGGYFDAGDWDRRIQHLDATRLLLELVELFPEYFAKVDLNIPESNDELPDVVNEALWNLDCYRRMQTKDGGIRGGIESAEHPRAGEASWQESLPVLAYAPGPWSSYIYAGVAARAAGVLERYDKARAKVYRDSALAAMEYAERVRPEFEKQMQRNAFELRDTRNLAALELFRVTGERHWHEVFLSTTVFTQAGHSVWQWQSHDQRHAAFIYATLQGAAVDETIRENARKALLSEADTIAETAEKTGFRWTKENPWSPVGYGTLCGQGAYLLLRAHHVSQDPKYLRAAVLATQYVMGANPANICLTTGLGHEFPKHPLVVDSRTMGVDAPPGLTVFGPMDMERNADYWTVKLFAPVTYPKPAEWPTLEAWFDLYLFPIVTEFTIHQPMAQVAYVWGYLSARGQ